jgi:cell division protein FtsL
MEVSMKKKRVRTYSRIEQIIMIVAILASIVCLILFINVMDDPEMFIDNRLHEIYMAIFIITFAIASFISGKDFVYALLEKGRYKSMEWHISQKAFKLVRKYIFLIFSVFLVTVMLEIVYDINDKYNELNHYIEEYDNYLADENYEVKNYVNDFYLTSKKYLYLKQNTMYLEGEFTEQFIAVYKSLKVQKRFDFRDVIEIDKDNFIYAANEDFYHVVQIITTLGYGDITPNKPIGMAVVWLAALSSQFITIVGVILIIRDK